ncbi:MAG: beta-galactosidase [Bacteroidetes bacterium]|nr:beta-galactosidase [Bacteroidota bacterium]
MKRGLVILLFLATAFQFGIAGKGSHTFSIGNNSFLLDGKPFRIISGEMHFARIPRECWRDRLHMAKAMGLNTIATYIFWNYHESEKGKFNFTGNADVAEFVRLAQEEGLWVIIRPSPYACAEWEFGGYPWWLLKEKGLTVRSRDPKFLELSRTYFSELGKQLVPLQVTNGGPIILVQLENEYGSYDKDKEYLTINKRIIRDAGFDIDMYTCDGPDQTGNGQLDGVLPALNGIDNVSEVKEIVRKYRQDGPYFIAEWYPGWFDSWGVSHHGQSTQECVGAYDSVLSKGLSINMYMAHGGTTRGFMNGANMDKRLGYSPQTSSYDYDAPIDEAGNATPKYMAFREVILKNMPKDEKLPEVPVKKKVISVPAISLKQTAELINNLPEPVSSDLPLTFEDLDQGYGYVLYRTNLAGPLKGILKTGGLRDYGLVYINGVRVAILDRRNNQDMAQIAIPKEGATLDILVENLGRINYGPFLNDNRKGITEKVLLNDTELKGWKMYRFPLTDTKGFEFKTTRTGNGPLFRKGSFVLKETGDTYLDLRSSGKGVAWVNGHNLGRFWNIGPQQTIYIPAPWLKAGENELIIFEELKPETDVIAMIDHPILDQLNNPRKVQPSLSTGKQIQIKNSFSEKYAAGGEKALVDAVRGSLDYLDNCWQGYEGCDMEVTINMGRAKRIHTITTGFLQNIESWIFLPSDVEYWASMDGINYTKIAVIRNDEPVNKENIFIKEFNWKSGDPVSVSPDKEAKNNEAPFDPNETVVYLKIVAHTIGTCPEGHPGAGKKAWIFADEILVN